MNHQADVFICAHLTLKNQKYRENMKFFVAGCVLRLSSVCKEKNKHHGHIISTRSLTKENDDVMVKKKGKEILLKRTNYVTSCFET